MEYFVVSTSKQIQKKVKFSFLPDDDYETQLKKWDFSILDPLKVCFYNPQGGEEIPDVLTEPCLLFSDKIRGVFETYWEKQWMKEQYFFVEEEKSKGNEDIQLDPDPNVNDFWRGLQLLPQEGVVFPRYWFLQMETVDCLHCSTLFYPNKMLQHLVLDKEKLPDNPYFKVGNLLEHRVIVNLDVAEGMMQCAPFGLQLTKVEVK